MSTLSHFDSAMAAHKGAFPVTYSDNMVTYSRDGHYFNSGLYTSRSNLKSYIRRASQVLHASSKMVTASLIEMLGMSPKKPEFAFNAHKMIQNLDGFEAVLSQSLSSDVITGTCRTGISEHYQKELEKWIKINFEQMTSLIHDWSEYLAGIQSAKSTNWEWCFRFYPSYTDCPIA